MIISSTGGRKHQLGEFECPTDPLYTDTFNRANGSLGADWTTRQGSYAISSNEAYPATSGTNCYTSYDTTMPGDNMAVGFVLGSKIGTLTDSSRLLLGCNSTGYGKALTVLATADTISIYDFEAWDTVGAPIDTVSVSLATGDEIIFARWGSIYTAFLNGTQLTDLELDDNTGIDSNHRILGLGGFHNATPGNYRRINTWNAYDL